jgi:hypothetical protein
MSRGIATIAFLGALLFALLVSRRGGSAPAVRDATRVTAIHPSTTTIPANLLRFHLEFSAPMLPGEAHEHVRLVDADGRVVEGAFLAAIDELWDPDNTRLTILLDPGRIKRGLRSQREMGESLQSGEAYRLVIDSAWRDARGVALAATVTRAFVVSAPDRDMPEPSRWTLSAPRVGTRDTLRVTFDGVLDNASVREALSVRAADGRLLPGSAALVSHDSAMTFVPAEPWAGTEHVVHIASSLEDPSGNSVVRRFDVDRSTDGAIEADSSSAPRLLRFRPRPR